MIISRPNKGNYIPLHKESIFCVRIDQLIYFTYTWESA